MGAADWRGACLDMRLENGLFWPLPITLSCGEDFGVGVGDEVALTDEGGRDSRRPHGHRGIRHRQGPGMPRGLPHDRRGPSRRRQGHGAGRRQPGGPGLGPLRGPLSRDLPGALPAPRRDPGALRRDTAGRRSPPSRPATPCTAATSFSPRSPSRCATGCSFTRCSARSRQGDIPADVRVRAIDWLVANHFPEGRVIQAGYPIEMRYAGPREALLHALFRQNFGCSHLVVGRDHAGLGGYYGPYDAHASSTRSAPTASPSGPSRSTTRSIASTATAWRRGTCASPPTAGRTRPTRRALSHGGGGGDGRGSRPALPPRRRGKAPHLGHAAARDVRRARGDPARIQPRRRGRHPPGPLRRRRVTLYDGRW